MAREIVKSHSSSSIGSVKQSMLDEATFQSIHGTGWVLMDGRDVTGSDYDTIVFGGIGGNIPDARGQFLRGKNNTRSDGNEDPDGERDLGNFQDDAIRNIVGDTTTGGPHLGPQNATGAFTWSSYTNGHAAGTATDGNGMKIYFNASSVVPTAGDNRPKNVAVNIFIKINE